MRLIKDKTSIDFLSNSPRSVALAISAVLIIVSIGSLITRGLDFGIDFTGGILLEVGYQQSADMQAIRSDLARDGYADAQVQRFGADNVVLVRLPPQEGDGDEIRKRLRATLASGGEQIDLRRVEFVSHK
jgi:preprotein translocase subunit SecF